MADACEQFLREEKIVSESARWRILTIATATFGLAWNAAAAKPGALDTVAMPPAAECLSVLDRGADPKGGKDSAAAFQKALDEAAGKKKVCVPEGSYRIGTLLVMRPGTHLVMHRNAVIARQVQSGGGNAGALIQSASFTEKTSGVTIEGGTFTSISGGKKYGGRVIGWFGDNWTVRNVVIRDWAQDGKASRAINAAGNSLRIEGNTIRNPGCGVGCAAIVVGGGENIVVADNDVIGGDDGIAVFPTANANDPTFNLPIRNVKVTNNRSSSIHARVFAMGLHYVEKISKKPMDTVVDGVHVSGLRGSVTSGAPGAMAVLVENMTPKGVVRNVVLDDIHVTQTNQLTDGFKIVSGAGGELSNVTLTNSSYSGSCKSAALKVIGVRGGSFERNKLVASQGCANAVFIDRKSTNIMLGRNETTGRVQR